MTTAGSPAPVRLELPAVEASVPRARTAIVALARSAGATDRIAADVALAVSEACTNVVLHAYEDTPARGPLIVRAELDGGALAVVVTDAGGGMAPRTDSPGLGMGLALMAAVSTSLQIDHDGAATVVHLTFDLRKESPESAGFLDESSEECE